jgi:hypothetical protein
MTSRSRYEQARSSPCYRPSNGDMSIRDAFQIGVQFALGVPEVVRILKA